MALLTSNLIELVVVYENLLRYLIVLWLIRYSWFACVKQHCWYLLSSFDQIAIHIVDYTLLVTAFNIFQFNLICLCSTGSTYKYVIWCNGTFRSSGITELYTRWAAEWGVRFISNCNVCYSVSTLTTNAITFLSHECYFFFTYVCYVNLEFKF